MLEKVANGNIDKLFNDLNKSEMWVLNEIQKNSKITISALRDIIGLLDTAIEKIQRNLKTKGYIERIGSNKNGYWNVLKNRGDFDDK